MNEDRTEQGRINEDSRGLGNVTWQMVRKRAREIAIINGRGPGEVMDSDFAQARRELTGEGDESPRDRLEESLVESERWDPVAGSPGFRAPTVVQPDEEVENERLVQEGVDEAEHDQMLQGSEESARRDEE
jgi:hypothetical protein